MSEVVYAGFTDKKGNKVVTRDGRALALGPSLKLWNHSPTGYEWGYGGSGPAQLALALLLDATGDKVLSVDLHQKFKAKIVSNFPRNGTWDLKRSQIMEWVKGEKQQGAQPAAVDALPPAAPIAEAVKKPKGSRE